MCKVAHLYRVPVSVVLEWSPDDQLAAVASLQDELEACPGCGLRPDQHDSVQADLSACPGCEARASALKQVDDPRRGLLVGFYPADKEASVWARYTKPGKEWFNAQRRRS